MILDGPYSFVLACSEIELVQMMISEFAAWALYFKE
jgi:NADH:ubiquinone oxidoreductase subunit B-like Fe-S oxidoreductase